MPFAGCPNRCSFCDQHSITGVVAKTTTDDVQKAIETALSSGSLDTDNSEIAFFGGSFTAIDREYMVSLLDAAKKYIHHFKGIRISTRPDCIDENILSLLKSYGVTAIELGAQSMCDDVLLQNDRGHNADSVRYASQLIKSYGFELGLQMMTGLYGSSDEKDTYTAQEFIKLRPDTVRIYPTVILKNTKLEAYMLSGEYVPMNVEDTVSLCAELITLFEKDNINVIRVGLHSSETVENSMLAGGYHPALRELCENKIYENLILKHISDKNIKKGNIIISVPKGAVSKVTGQKKKNLTALQKMGYFAKVSEDPSLVGRQISIQEG